MAKLFTMSEKVSLFVGFPCLNTGITSDDEGDEKVIPSRHKVLIPAVRHSPHLPPDLNTDEKHNIIGREKSLMAIIILTVTVMQTWNLSKASHAALV